MADPASTTVIIPAYNEAEVIAAVIAGLKGAGSWHEIIVVDDGSTDATAEHARRAGATVVRHPYNKGNGAAVKTGLRRAASEFVLIMDGDGQHTAADAGALLAPLGEYDLVVGARPGSGHASLARRMGNRLLNTLAAYLTERAIPDLTSGIRAGRREYFREFLHLLPNGFSTPATTTLAFVKAGYNVTFHPIGAERRVGRSKIRFINDGTTFLLIVLKVVTFYSPMRIFLPISALAFAGGAAYAVWTIATQSHVTNSSVLLIVFAVIVFLVGLVSEQIAALRFESR